MDSWLIPALILAGGYLLGSIPFGIIVTRAAGAADPRQIGSGNIGATNVLRTGRRGLAAFTLLLDAGKGAAAVLLGESLLPGSGALAAIGAFFGHVFPVWLRFRGGKGVATFLGIVLALHWPTGLIALVLWLAATFATRYSSVGGMTAAIASPVLSAFFFRADLTILFLALALIVLWRHRDNIERLLSGTESRIGAKAG
ncbi:glycerol-3-phosphate 1-O-acyltransferase PlsY [Sphingomonas sp.]|uniref:glycerol-3-phosphate 1-O-acyltransferase PlsY n=1 Tax=Sphingomonas sp. TaxID=28214 RepID=UPI003B3A9EE3